MIWQVCFKIKLKKEKEEEQRNIQKTLIYFLNKVHSSRSAGWNDCNQIKPSFLDQRLNRGLLYNVLLTLHTEGFIVSIQLAINLYSYLKKKEKKKHLQPLT